MLSLSERTVIYVGAIAYYVKALAEIHLSIPEGTSQSSTAVVITVPQAVEDLDSFLKDRLQYFSKNDDVYSPPFGDEGTVVLQYQVPPPKVIEELGQKHVSRFVKLPIDDHGSQLPEGPYFLKGTGLHQVWRLYTDNFEAFTVSTVPNAANEPRFEPLQVSAYDSLYKAVAVPSRLYYKQTDELPLNGIRISIKDNIDLAGVKTTLGNRAFTELYGPQERTAAYILELMQKGAVIVGKTKLNAFAGSEKPPDQCIDYFAPWNPRADGYLRPAGSSSGAGVSVAGYDWLDYAVGTDTTGSVREPARACGVWGIKLTQGILPDEGLKPSCRSIDSFGLFTRSAEELYEFTRISLGDRVSSEKLPKKMIYPTDWLPQKNEVARKLSEEFFKILEDALGITRTEICIADEWKRTAPETVRDIPISDYLKNSGFYPLYYDNYHNYDDFRSAYKTQFGKEVYVSPSQGWKWDLGSKVTPEQRDQGVAEIQVYRDWMHKYILTSDENGAPDTIIALPLGAPTPEYRDQTNKPPSVVPSFEPKYLASVLGLPQIVVPIGQNPYESRVSKRVEYVPAIATFAAPRGGDLMLIKTAQAALEKAGWPTRVLTGRNAFEPGNNSRHVASTMAKLA